MAAATGTEVDGAVAAAHIHLATMVTAAAALAAIQEMEGEAAVAGQPVQVRVVLAAVAAAVAALRHFVTITVLAVEALVFTVREATVLADLAAALAMAEGEAPGEALAATQAVDLAAVMVLAPARLEAILVGPVEQFVLYGLEQLGNSLLLM